MNTAACLLAEPMVLPLEAVPVTEPERPEEAVPPLAGVSLKVPSDRDLQIYETAVFAGRSQREVAKEFGVSQPRVNQVLKEMAGKCFGFVAMSSRNMRGDKAVRRGTERMTCRKRFRIGDIQPRRTNVTGMQRPG